MPIPLTHIIIYSIATLVNIIHRISLRQFVPKKHPIEAALAMLKEAQDIAVIDAAIAELNNVFHAASQEQSQAQQGPQGNPNPGNAGGNNGGDNITDVDFEEVK